MKVKIKSFNGELPYYLTLNTEYTCAKPSSEDDYIFIDDDINYTRAITLKNCWHLNGGSWEIVE